MNDSGTVFFAAGERVRTRTIMRNVYLWMTLGLALTAIVAYWAANTPAVLNIIFRTRFTYLALIIGELALVMFLSSRIMKMSVGAAVASFAGYSILNGLTLSSIFLVYTGSHIYQAFIVAAGTFAVMSLWAVTTKRDLSSWGHYLFMGLIGLLIASFVGVFVANDLFVLIYSGVGALLFTALTAYDTQRIKAMSDQIGTQVGEADYVRLSILGALRLYLDFINLFLMVLRLLGRRR